MALKLRAIIVDFDGTLALKGARRPFDYDRVDEDGPNTSVIKLVQAYRRATGCWVLIVSGREDTGRCRMLSEAWLAAHNVTWDALFMREERDYRKDAVVKEELYVDHIQPFYEIDYVLDDRDQTVAAWRALGLPCFQVARGDF